jgi:lysophospholipase L1-like esterase
MKISAPGRAELWLLLASVSLSIAVLVGAYETVENIRYERWKSQFDVIGLLTVPSANPVLMWEYRPNESWAELQMNRWGFRDRDYETPAKPPGTYRFAFIGDSVALGLGVAAEDVFVRRFEDEANRLGLPHTVQALNFSVDGYNAVQMHELLRTKALPFAPDKVVYVLCLNDFDFEDASGQKILYFRKPKSFFLEMLEQVYRQRIYQQLAGGDFHHYHFEKNKQAAFQSIRDMNALAKQSGIGFHVVVLPIFPDKATDFSTYPLRDIHGEIGVFLSRQGIQHLDLLEAFAGERKPPAFYSNDIWHPNAQGHLLIARRTLQALIPAGGDHAGSAADRSPAPAGGPAADLQQDAAAPVIASCSNTDARIIHASPADREPSVPHRTQSPASACMRTVASPDEPRSPPPVPSRAPHTAPGCCTPAAAPAH